MSQSLDQIRNYAQLNDRIGTAGQPKKDQFQLIAEHGFETVINIAMPEHADSIDNEASLVTRLGMNYIHLPVPFDCPKIHHLQQFCRLLQAQQQRRLFIHCIMNYRVSVFIYHYLIAVEGYAQQDARSPIFARWEIEPEWQAMMELDSLSLNLSGFGE